MAQRVLGPSLARPAWMAAMQGSVRARGVSGGAEAREAAANSGGGAMAAVGRVGRIGAKQIGLRRHTGKART